VPHYVGAGGTVARYDTRSNAGIADASSWSFFRATDVDPKAEGFTGATFDGRYLYFVPFANGVAGYSAFFARYDTHAAFADKRSWLTFDLGSGPLGAFAGGAFDGRYVYFPPNGNDGPGREVARYDTQGAFDTKSSWSVFDTTTIDPNAKGYFGCRCREASGCSLQATADHAGAHDGSRRRRLGGACILEPVAPLGHWCRTSEKRANRQVAKAAKNPDRIFSLVLGVLRVLAVNTTVRQAGFGSLAEAAGAY
jgi:hypothetical protein